MYIADLQHPHQTLQDKLYKLYNLRADKDVELGFRPEYIRLLSAFGDPHLNLPPVVHVAGTNGKGSTIAILRAILESLGKRVHVFTSPHLRQFNERIVLAGRYIDNVKLEHLIDEALHLNGDAPVSFFEITTAMAFAAFSRVPADVVLLEVGLGGRLDCTNIAPKPSVSIINKISRDHTEYLGETLSEIAAEKGGIIKYETPCVLGYQSAEFEEENVKSVFEEIARTQNAPLHHAGSGWSCVSHSDPLNGVMRFSFGDAECVLPRPSLLGAHQVHNAGAALAALKILENKGIVTWDADLIAQGLQNVVWPARMECIDSGALPALLPQDWELWFDGGHNDTASDAIVAQLRGWADMDSRPLHLIVALKGDKDAPRFLRGLLPFCASLTFTDIHGVGSFVERDDFECLMKEHFPAQDYGHQPSLKDALVHIAHTQECRAEPGRVLICGSLYLGRQVYES